MRRSNSFTLIEILVSVVILAVLAAIVIIAINPAKQLAQARNSNRIADANNLLKAVTAYRIEHGGSLPGEIDNIPIMVGNATSGCSTACGAKDGQPVAQTFKISSTQGGFGTGLDNTDYFGYALGGIGDIDNDSIPDLAVGATGDDDGGSARGAVWIIKLKADGTRRPGVSGLGWIIAITSAQPSRQSVT